MPSHSHDGVANNIDLRGRISITDWTSNAIDGIISSGTGTSANAPEGKYWQSWPYYTINASHGHSITTNDTGSNVAHNVIQPYIVCYIWKRVS